MMQEKTRKYAPAFSVVKKNVKLSHDNMLRELQTLSKLQVPVL